MSRPDKETIVIGGSCDVETSNWTARMIVGIEVPQLAFAVGYPGRVTCHRSAAGPIATVFAAWEEADLMHLVMTWSGCFMPRYKRGQAPDSAGGHGPRSSADVAALSNHVFGSAFDINFADNPFGAASAKVGRRGCVCELVEIANRHGFYWSGHFGTTDVMHFEIARLEE